MIFFKPNKPNYLAAAVLVLSLTAASGCAFHHHRPEDFYFGDYSEAEALYNRGQYDQAIHKYQSYIDENPEGNLAVISQYYIARCHASLGHTDAAKELYKKIIAEHADLVWANFSETQLKELEKSQAAPAALANKV